MATYIVQKGDTLSGIGAKKKIAWRNLAKWNNIVSPYTIHVGQVLQLQAPVTPTPTPTPTPQPSPQPSPSPSTDGVPFGHRKFGAYVEDNSGATLWELTPLINMETKLGHKLDVVSGFCQGSDLPDLVPNMKKVIAGGRICMLSYDVQYSGADILAGKYDTVFQKDAGAAKSVGGEVICRLWAESNLKEAAWAPGSPSSRVSSISEWIAAWKHIVTIFRNAGASNTKFCWCPNGTDSDSKNKFELYYPGSDFVDTTGFDIYNWNDPWLTHTQIYTEPYKRLVALAPDKDIWIGETGSAEGSTPDKKATWLTNMLKETGFPKIVGIAYFSCIKEAKWDISSSTASLQAFQMGLG